MTWISTRPTKDGGILPDALLWVSDGEHPDGDPTGTTMAGIRIPIPWAFWHYRAEYDADEHAYWWITLAIRRDDRPIRYGKLPTIRFGWWLTRRKLVSQIIMRMPSRSLSGRGLS